MRIGRGVSQTRVNQQQDERVEGFHRVAPDAYSRLTHDAGRRTITTQISVRASMFGKQNASPIEEAREDFVRRSLQPLQTGWERVVFTFRLRRKSEPYTHWGLEQAYGESAAREAIGEAHLQVVKKFLGTGVSKSLPEVQTYAANAAIPVERAIELVDVDRSGLPPQLSPPEVAHVAVELETLRALTKR